MDKVLGAATEITPHSPRFQDVSSLSAHFRVFDVWPKWQVQEVTEQLAEFLVKFRQDLEMDSCWLLIEKGVENKRGCKKELKIGEVAKRSQ